MLQALSAMYLVARQIHFHPSRIRHVYTPASLAGNPSYQIAVEFQIHGVSQYDESLHSNESLAFDNAHEIDLLCLEFQ